MDDLDLPNPSHSRDVEHLEGAELQKIKMEGAKLSLQIERYLQQQSIAQTNARTPVLADHSHVKYVSECDAERRQHQEEINPLAEKLKDKETECNLKINLLTEKLGDKEAGCKTLTAHNPVSRLQMDLAVATDCVARLRETVARQNEVISSLKRNRSYLAMFDPPSYEEKAAFSSSSVS